MSSRLAGHWCVNESAKVIVVVEQLVVHLPKPGMPAGTRRPFVHFVVIFWELVAREGGPVAVTEPPPQDRRPRSGTFAWRARIRASRFCPGASVGGYGVGQGWVFPVGGHVDAFAPRFSDQSAPELLSPIRLGSRQRCTTLEGLDRGYGGSLLILWPPGSTTTNARASVSSP